MKTGFLLSVSIRVHPWLDHIGCGFAALRRIAGFQTRRWHDITRPADLEIGDTAGLETCATTRSCAAGKFAQENKTFTPMVLPSEVDIIRRRARCDETKTAPANCRLLLGILRAGISGRCL